MNDLTPEQISSLGSQALLITLLITTVLGAIMQKTSFCTLGAVSDGILMEDWSRMRQWCLAIGIAILGVALMSHLGWIDVSKSFYTGTGYFICPLSSEVRSLVLVWSWHRAVAVRP